jgi:hypothetical protein
MQRRDARRVLHQLRRYLATTAQAHSVSAQCSARIGTRFVGRPHAPGARPPQALQGTHLRLEERGRAYAARHVAL